VPGTVRRPVAAGSFYDADPRVLASTVDRLLEGAAPSAAERPRGLIAPHAGYAHSGPVAASAFVTLRPFARSIVRVALFGPSHFVALEGCAVSPASAWRTPLGDAEVDDELRAAALGHAVADERPHAFEHAIEVELPFLQRLLGAVRILPVAVGRATSHDVARTIDAVATLADLLVVSTDLSHYRDADTARRLDRRTADAIVARDPDAVGPDDACGLFALRGALAHARVTGAAISLLDLRNSADTSGGPGRVVGYGAFAIG
jgi:AmmeMemoRadiSam system protein B